jgi:peptidoglycan/xylan/chitin deacetylase (PgdA/CDA1 family)
MTPVLAALVVFMYHRVADDVPRNPVGRALTVPTARFRAQLDALAARHVPVVTAEEAARALAARRRVNGVVLSFDDGRSDAYGVVFPMLMMHRMRGSFYVNPGTIDAAFHMTWGQVRALRVNGMEVGCHGMHHLDLARLDAAEQRAEIAGCVEAIARHAHARPNTYAYA